jgi:hypothetical protein
VVVAVKLAALVLAAFETIHNPPSGKMPHTNTNPITIDTAINVPRPFMVFAPSIYLIGGMTLV